jgi:CubicO group peptidase (beta-lactamase class C family)
MSAERPVWLGVPTGARALPRRRAIVLGLAASCAVAACTSVPLDPTLRGEWTAVLESGSQRLRLRLAIGTDGRASLYSVDQDNQAIESRVLRTGDGLELTASSIQAKFAGRLHGDDRIEGMWSQGGVDLPLVWLRGDAGYAVPARRVEPLSQDALDALRRQCGAPALAAAAQRGSGETLRLVSGVRSSFSHTAVTVQDVWHLGSITKAITATLVARLVEADKVRWTDTVGELLGSAMPQMRAEYRDVSFRHLLSHRAGLPGDIPLWQFLRFALGDPDDVIEARRRYATIALGMEPLSAPGASFAYANNGYVVAGAMLEAKLGESTEGLIRRHVFAPLGLTTAGFGPPGQPGGLTQPLGHQHDIESVAFSVVGLHPLKPQPPGSAQSDNPVPLGPAGRAHMSMDDLLHFLSAHRDRTAFLSPRSWDELHTPPFGGQYAMGWVRRPDGALWHNGSNNRWYAEVLVDATDGVCACAFANEARGPARVAVGQSLLRAARAL